MKVLSLIILAILCTASHVYAEESLEQVLTRIKITEAKQFLYKETRQMQLLNQPWEASGEMYLSPSQAIIAEQTPGKKISAITKNRMLYANLDQNKKYVRLLKDSQNIPGLGAFLTLFHGEGKADSKFMQLFSPQLNQTKERWHLMLTPNSDKPSPIKTLQLTGKNNQNPDKLNVIFQDGDETEWQLTLLSTGAKAEAAIQNMLDKIESIPSK